VVEELQQIGNVVPSESLLNPQFTEANLQQQINSGLSPSFTSQLMASSVLTRRNIYSGLQSAPQKQRFEQLAPD
jgi:hypothetical protein